MVLISFSVSKEEVRNGIKEMTIRKLRKRPIKQMDLLHLYWKCRTKECEKLKEEYCLFEFKLTWKQITLLKYRGLLAQLDNFDDWYAMEQWFHETHGKDLYSETFQIICWGKHTALQLRKILLPLEKEAEK